MSGETTPRPWRMGDQWNDQGTVGILSAESTHGHEDVVSSCCEHGIDPATANLIVRAVNQHDALVAFVETVRKLHASAGEGLGDPPPRFGDVWLCSECDQNYPCDTARAVADLDAQVGGPS